MSSHHHSRNQETVISKSEGKDRRMLRIIIDAQWLTPHGVARSSTISRVGSGQKVFNISRVWSGRVGLGQEIKPHASGRSRARRPDSTRPDPTRSDLRVLIRHARLDPTCHEPWLKHTTSAGKTCRYYCNTYEHSSKSDSTLRPNARYSRLPCGVD